VRLQALATAALCVTLAAVVPAAPAAADEPVQVGEGLELPSWLRGREADAAWLMEPGKRPRALVSLEDHRVEVVLYLPELDVQAMVRIIEEYAAWEQTDQVEAAFCSDGAFFTGARLQTSGLRMFAPTVTRYIKEVAPDRMLLEWTLMPIDEAREFVRGHRAEMERALRAAGLKRDVDDYIQETIEELGAIAHVQGSHCYESGFYRHTQEIRSSSELQDAIVEAFGTRAQLRAALKSALFSVGLPDLAGRPGKRGVRFDVRGVGIKKLRPGT